jgi:hypothetical protein
MGAKEGELSTVHVWAAVFHYVTVRSYLVCILKLMNVYFLNFQILEGLW